MNRVAKLSSRHGYRQAPGQTMAEYGLIIALVALAAIAAWTALGGNINTLINSVATTI
jgi:Flp pilus assembly pilin Flp